MCAIIFAQIAESRRFFATIRTQNWTIFAIRHTLFCARKQFKIRVAGRDHHMPDIGLIPRLYPDMRALRRRYLFCSDRFCGQHPDSGKLELGYFAIGIEAGIGQNICGGFDIRKGDKNHFR